MNVLLLMTDEHHARYTGVGGHPTVRTPHIDRLAQMGCMFDNAYCPSPLCSPSRSAFASGRRVHQLQWYNNGTLFPRQDPTYGGVLREQSVHTVYIGKTHLQCPIAEAGFSQVIEAPAAAG
jgi:choline-sulfatase